MRRYAERYPRLLERALIDVFGLWAPALDEPIGTWLEAGGVGRLSWAILAAQTCRCAVAEVEDARLQALVDDYKDQPQTT
mmetsp:Transcript_5285/g.13539  ORF Transcript_5285/g.13539 Transcript_5285/m.13539 type:complete len:80 (+) Transcript_5285:319-558(+)